jgi:hypothetical protein
MVGSIKEQLLIAKKMSLMYSKAGRTAMRTIPNGITE